jgi:hypothetical protein
LTPPLASLLIYSADPQRLGIILGQIADQRAIVNGQRLVRLPRGPGFAAGLGRVADRLHRDRHHAGHDHATTQAGLSATDAAPSPNHSLADLIDATKRDDQKSSVSTAGSDSIATATGMPSTSLRGYFLAGEPLRAT